MRWHNWTSVLLIIFFPTSSSAIRLPFLSPPEARTKLWLPSNDDAFPALPGLLHSDLSSSSLSSPHILDSESRIGVVEGVKRPPGSAALRNKTTGAPRPPRPSDRPHPPPSSLPLLQQTSSSQKRDLNYIPDNWYIQRAYQGQSFFDNWGFATYADPTHGQVLYVSKEQAMSTNMSYINNKGQAVMRVDNWSQLAPGAARNSIRIESNDVFNKGLFLLDVEQAPWGCGVWPAWWTVGSNWPWNGEIDILEGVHDNVHNQVTFHTGDDCYLLAPNVSTPAPQNYTGWQQTNNCYAYEDSSNSGCAVIDPSVASYGTQFNVLGGGVFAMMWLDDGIRVWFFHRAALPADIVESAPTPSKWGPPVTFLGNGCNVDSHFADHQLVFDITFCGDWAGSSYISSGCPGTCSERVQDPNNFANASWTINYVHVYGSPNLKGGDIGSSAALRSMRMPGLALVFSVSVSVLFASAAVLFS